MKNFVLILMIFLASCNFSAKKTLKLSDSCLVVDTYDKVLCLEQPTDELYEYVFLDKNRLEKEDIKFSDLQVYDFIVVDLEINGINTWVTFSNEKHSIVVKWSYDVPKIGDKYKIICKESHLKESKLVKTESEGNLLEMDESSLDASEMDLLEP
jgi:hypothetical protein